ncbi:MAG: hypothetical protein RLP44_26090 [Aggregatilineales bacterium]
MRIFSTVLILLSLLLLSACEQEATPFPIELPATETPALAENSLPPLRYGVSVNATNIIPALGSNSELVIISEAIDPNQLGSSFDLLLTFGQVDGWTQGTPITVSLILLPLQPPELNIIVSDSISAQEIIDSLAVFGGTSLYNPARVKTELRDELANMGRPDGFSLSIGYINVPGAEFISSQFSAVNIDTRAEPLSLQDIRNGLQNNMLQIGVVVWSSEDERNSWMTEFPDATLLDLYSLPISYLVVPEYTVEFGTLNFPIITR